MLAGHGYLFISIISLEKGMSRLIPYPKKHFLGILGVGICGKNRLGTVPTTYIPISFTSFC